MEGCLFAFGTISFREEMSMKFIKYRNHGLDPGQAAS